MSKAWHWFAGSAAIVLVDQLTKWIVLAHFAPGERRELTGFFNLVLVFNKGAAFSFLADAAGWQTPIPGAFSLVAALIVPVLRLRPQIAAWLDKPKEGFRKWLTGRFRNSIGRP